MFLTRLAQPLATALRRNLHDLCDRIEANMRGVAMMDVQLRVSTAPWRVHCNLPLRQL